MVNSKLNLETDGSIVNNIIIRSYVKESAELKGNTNLIVKEDKEGQKLVQMGNIFDGDIDEASKDVMLLKTYPIRIYL